MNPFSKYVLPPLAKAGVDGVDHINTNKDHALSRLGALLDRASAVQVKHPVLGSFRTARNFEVWVSTPGHDDAIRTASGAFLRKIKHPPIESYQFLAVEAIYYKIKRNRELSMAVKNNELPFDYYWRQGSGKTRIKTRPANTKFVAAIEVAAKLIKTGVDVREFSSQSCPDIYSAFSGLMD